MGKSTPAEVRFWAKVDKSAGHDSCWLWTAYRNPKGYGRFFVDGARVYATRWVYGREIGPIPDGLHVLHRCDNPPCVNPAHLFTGTNAENVADREAKGRARHPGGDEHWSRRSPARVARGGQVANAKLTAEQVVRIRDLYATGGVSQRALAEDFGVSQPMIGQIIRRVWWQHL